MSPRIPWRGQLRTRSWRAWSKSTCCWTRYRRELGKKLEGDSIRPVTGSRSSAFKPVLLKLAFADGQHRLALHTDIINYFCWSPDCIRRPFWLLCTCRYPLPIEYCSVFWRFLPSLVCSWLELFKSCLKTSHCLWFSTRKKLSVFKGLCGWKKSGREGEAEQTVENSPEERAHETKYLLSLVLLFTSGPCNVALIFRIRERLMTYFLSDSSSSKAMFCLLASRR